MEGNGGTLERKKEGRKEGEARWAGEGGRGEKMGGGGREGGRDLFWECIFQELTNEN